jgi:hypothetical protein
MLVELAAANAAFAVIKETVQNGGDLMAAGQKLFDFFDNKNALQKKANSGSDIEAFAALEQLKTSEAELKRMMIYHGRAGLWDDWLQFQKEAKQRREAAEREAARKKAARIEKAWIIVMWSAVFVLMCTLTIIGLYVVNHLKGR